METLSLTRVSARAVRPLATHCRLPPPILCFFLTAQDRVAVSGSSQARARRTCWVLYLAREGTQLPQHRIGSLCACLLLHDFVSLCESAQRVLTLLKAFVLVFSYRLPLSRTRRFPYPTLPYPGAPLRLHVSRAHGQRGPLRKPQLLPQLPAAKVERAGRDPRGDGRRPGSLGRRGGWLVPSGRYGSRGDSVVLLRLFQPAMCYRTYGCCWCCLPLPMRLVLAPKPSAAFCWPHTYIRGCVRSVAPAG